MHSQHAQRPGSGLTGVSIPTTSTRCSFARSPCRVATRSRTASLLSIRSNHQTPTSARSARPVVAAAAQQEQRASCSGRQLNAGSSAPADVSPCQSPAAPAAHLQDHWSLASARLLGEGHSALLSVTLAAGMGGMLGGFGLNGPNSTLSSLGILALIVTVHECGHFLAARLQGIHVTQFAIGFGPPLLTFKAKEVEYSLRLIPLGGYVAFPDGQELQRQEQRAQAEGGKPSTSAAEDGQAKGSSRSTERVYDPNDPDLLKNRSIPERAAVISAGVIANIIFAYFALLVQVSTVGKAITDYLPGVRIPEVTNGSAAYRAGFQNNDVIVAVDGWQVPSSGGQVQDVVQRIRQSSGRLMNFQVQRDGTVIEVPCEPDVQSDGTGRIGVQIYSNAKIDHVKATNPADAVRLATDEFNRLSGVVANGLTQIVTNFGKMAGQLSGPVAIVAAGSEIARVDSAGLFQFCAIININLAAVNILPLPALDGGYMLLLLIEALRGGRKLPQDLEQGFQASGLLLLTAMGMGLVVRDTINLFH